MRRSRRSLAFLLASISLSLVIVRSTSAPAGLARTNAAREPTVRQAKLLPSAHGILSRAVAVSAPSSSAPRAQAAAPTLPADHPNDNQKARSNSAASSDVPPTSHAVSATAIIVVLRNPAWHARLSARAGWSGCTAYANGCDHLGRSYPSRTAPRLVDRLFLRDLVRLVDAMSGLPAGTVALLSGGDWSSLLPHVANDRSLSKSEPAARQTNWSDWRL